MREQRRIVLGGTAKSPEDVRKLHDLGLAFAEIPIRDPSTFSRRVARYQGLKESLGVFYLCHGPLEGDPNDILSLERVYLPKILALLPFMKDLEMPLLTIHLWLDPRFVRRDVIDFKITMLNRILKKTGVAGVTLCIENLSENADDFMVAFTALPQLFMTLDLGHAQLLSEKNTSHGFIERFSDRIKHVHVHDNRGGQSQADDLHLPPGEGIVDFKSIMGELQGKDYRGTMSLELTPLEIKRCLHPLRDLIFRKR